MSKGKGVAIVGNKDKTFLDSNGDGIFGKCFMVFSIRIFNAICLPNYESNNVEIDFRSDAWTDLL